jgi:LysM repeat protein
MTKRVFQWILISALLVASFASTGSAAAWGGCASYAVVQWGDTLSSLAALCGTTVQAIQAANPGVGGWLWAGQVLYIPTGSSSTYTTAYQGHVASGTYTVQWGDSLGNIATKNGISISSILSVNPQIWNADLIFPGQVINLPAAGSTSGSAYNLNPASGTSPTSTYRGLKVTNFKGLLIHSGPGTNYPTIESSTASAVYRSTWMYRRNSVTVDNLGLVWVQILLSSPVNGYSSGWIMVKDGLGNYFTDPHIN